MGRRINEQNRCKQQPISFRPGYILDEFFNEIMQNKLKTTDYSKSITSLVKLALKKKKDKKFIRELKNELEYIKQKK